MSDRPTPETDAEHAQFAMGGFTLDFCRKLERERDDAREALSEEMKFHHCTHAELVQTQCQLQDVRHEQSSIQCAFEDSQDKIEQLERERDEARELCRELVDLVAYGLGQNGSFWSQAAMRQAREKIQKAKALEAK